VCEELASHELHVNNDAIHADEHAIEIELPFLQTALGKFRLVPVLVGQLRDEDAATIAEAFRPYVTPTTLVVASSDFTHYGPNYGYVPFTDDVAENLRSLDMGAVERVIARDFDGYMAYLREKRPTICGRYAIAILLHLLPSDTEGRVLKYDTSGRVTGDYTNSVSYVSIAFSTSSVPSPGALSLEEQKTLLRIARETVEQVVRRGEASSDIGSRHALTAPLKARGAAFVTLHKRGQLRGCIGRIPYPGAAEDLPPLHSIVSRMAVQSATRDWRFQPVQPDELDDVEIEISVLSMARQVDGPEEFKVGEHGIIIRKGMNSAVFLPQVAPEQGWDRAETLTQLCRKAGLEGDAWREPGMQFFVFTAQVFDESLLNQ